MFPFYPALEEVIDVYHKHEWSQGSVFSRSGEVFEVEVARIMKECTRFDFRLKKNEGVQKLAIEALTGIFRLCHHENEAEVNAVVGLCFEFGQIEPYEYWVNHLEFYEVVFQTLKEDDEDFVRLSAAFRMNKHFHYDNEFMHSLWSKASGESHHSGRGSRLEFHLFCHYVFCYHDGLKNVATESPSSTEHVASLLEDIPEVQDVERRGIELSTVLSLGDDEGERRIKMPTLQSDLLFMQTDSTMTDRTDCSDDEGVDLPYANDGRDSLALSEAANFSDLYAEH